MSSEKNERAGTAQTRSTSRSKSSKSRLGAGPVATQFPLYAGAACLSYAFFALTGCISFAALEGFDRFPLLLPDRVDGVDRIARAALRVK